MPQNSQSHHSPCKLICPVEGCQKECQSYSGLTQHLRRKHEDYKPGSLPAIHMNNTNIHNTADSDIEMSSPDFDLDMGDSGLNNAGLDPPQFTSPSPSLHPNSPSQDTKGQGTPSLDAFTEYHPVINGKFFFF